MGLYCSDGLSVNEQKKQINKKLGSSIRTVRNKNGQTQKEFIDDLEIRGGKTLISQVENGKKTLPANILPIIADKGKRTVESLFRECVYAEDNPFYKCLNLMDVDSSHYRPIMKYLNTMVDSAIEKVGPEKIFDMMFSMVRTSSSPNYSDGKIAEEILICEKDDYRKFNRSRYINYIEEMAVYSRNNV